MNRASTPCAHTRTYGNCDVRRDEGIGRLFAAQPKDLVPTANLADGVWQALRAAWNLKGDLKSKAAKTLCRALFRYCVAIAHSPQYETDHKDALGQGWPRVPIVKDRDEVDKVVKLGDHIAALLNLLADASSSLKTLLGTDAKTVGVVRRVGGGSVKESS